MKDLILIIVPSLFTALIGWILGRRRENVDLCGERLDDLEKSINVYNIIIDDMSKKIEELTGHIAKLEIKIEDLMKENKKLRKQSKINL